MNTHEIESLVEKNKTTADKQFNRTTLIFLAFSILTFIITIMFVHIDEDFTNHPLVIKSLIVICASLLMGGIMALSLTPNTERFNARNIWVDINMNIVFSPHGTFLVPMEIYKKITAVLKKIDLDRPSTYSAKISIICPNEKVRNFQFTANIRWDGPAGDLEKFLKENHMINQVTTGFHKSKIQYDQYTSLDEDETIDVLKPFLEYYLIEFLEKNGRELGELYNPKATAQQNKYIELLHNYFTELGYPLKIDGSFKFE